MTDCPHSLTLCFPGHRVCPWKALSSLCPPFSGESTGGEQQVLANAQTKKAACRELSFCCRLLSLSLLGSFLAWTHEGNSSLLSRGLFILSESSGCTGGSHCLSVHFCWLTVLWTAEPKLRFSTQAVVSPSNAFISAPAAEQGDSLNLGVPIPDRQREKTASPTRAEVLGAPGGEHSFLNWEVKIHTGKLLCTYVAVVCGMSQLRGPMNPLPTSVGISSFYELQ